MHPYNLVQWNGKKAEGIVLPEVLLAGGGKKGQILEALNILRSNSGLLEFVMVKGNVIVDLPGDALESLELQLFQLNSFHELQFRLPVIHFHTLVILLSKCYKVFVMRKPQGISILPKRTSWKQPFIAKNNCARAFLWTGFG
jgi:hypothetical protein